MDEEGFRQFMKQQRRSQGTMDSCVDFTQAFETYLNTHFDRMELNEAQPEHLDAFLSDIKSARVRLLFDTGFDTIEKIAAQDPVEMREQIMEINQREKIADRHPTLTETKFWVAQAKKTAQAR